MNKLEVKIKKLDEKAVIPTYVHSGDCGLDLTAISAEYVVESVGTNICDIVGIKYRTGIAIEIPDGYVGLIFPRSSIYQKNLTLPNSVGVIDSGYRGEIQFIFDKRSEEQSHRNIYNVGDRIGQLVIVPCPQIELVETDELSETERGTDGFGSSGD